MNTDAMRNRRAWDAASDEYQRDHREQLTAKAEAWGVWSIPETELQLVGEVARRDVLEFGCGGAQWSIALAKPGARCTALDNSQRQLEHAREAIAQAHVDVRLVHAAAEDAPFPDGSFDLVFCDRCAEFHGAGSHDSGRRTVVAARRHGFTIEKLFEPRPTEDAVTTYQSFAPYDWARDFPLELMVRARLG